jgi:hypothetical protein
MLFDARRFFEGSRSDFFYLMLRDGRPHGAQAWVADAGEHPPPTWIPAVHHVRIESLGIPVEIDAIAAARFSWEIRPGKREVLGETALGPLSNADRARTLVAIGLGIANRRDNQRGLTLDGVQTLPIRPHLGVLAASPDGVLSISRSVEALAPRGDASELTLLVEAGELRSEARKLGLPRRRAAACMDEGGTFLVAHAEVDNFEPIATVLRDLGCRRVVELNRGRQARSFIHRAGTDRPPEAAYDESVLYGLARPSPGGVEVLR